MHALRAVVTKPPYFQNCVFALVNKKKLSLLLLYSNDKKRSSPVSVEDEVEPLLNHLNSVATPHHQVHHGAGEGWFPSLPRHQANTKGGGRSGRDGFQETYAHRQVPALQLPPPSKCKEGSRQESLRQGQERHSTEGEPARGRRTPHHHFQTEQLSLTLHPCHLFHTVTINVTRGGVR